MARRQNQLRQSSLALFRLVVSLLFVVCAVGPAAAHDKAVAGFLEIVTIYPNELNVSAQMNTGSLHSILFVPSHNIRQRDKEMWLRFTVSNRQNESETFEREIINFQGSGETGIDTDRNPIISLGICVGNSYKETNIVVVQQKMSNVALVLGRPFLQSHLLVDSGKPFLTDPACKLPNTIK